MELATTCEKCNYDLLKFLLPKRELYFLDSEYRFGEKLKEKIKNYKLFPTISGEYISIDDGPKYSDIRFDNIVSPQTFSTLLLHCEDETILRYMKEVGIGFYDEATMVTMLNKDADDYTKKKQNTSLIVLFRAAFPYAKSAPKLLIDSNGNRVTEDNVTVYHNPDKQFELPVWCNMRFISVDMEESLLREWNCSSRDLMKNLAIYGGSEYSFDRVLRELISQSKNDSVKVLDLLHWLFGTWEKNDQRFDTSFSGVNVQAVSRSGEIVSIAESFLGSEYGNFVGERIISCLENPIFLADHVTLGFDDSKKEICKTFLTQLGAKVYPAIESRKLSSTGNEEDEYINYNSITYPVIKTVYGEEFACNTQSDGLFCYPWCREVKIADIIGITEILKKASYLDILYWICDDEQLRRHIRNTNEIKKEIFSCFVKYYLHHAKLRRRERCFPSHI